MGVIKFLKFSKGLFLANSNSYFNLSKQKVRDGIFSYLIIFLLSIILPLYKTLESSNYYYFKIILLFILIYCIHLFFITIIFAISLNILKGVGNFIETFKYILSINYIQTLYLSVFGILLVYQDIRIILIYFLIFFIFLKPWIFILSVTILKTYNRVSLIKSFVSHMVIFLIYSLIIFFIIKYFFGYEFLKQISI